MRDHWRERAWAGVVAELLLPPLQIVIVAFWTVVTLAVLAAIAFPLLSLAGIV